MLQDYQDRTIRAAASVTNAFVAGTVMGTDTFFPNLHLQNQLLLYVKVTIGALAYAAVKIEFSNDNSTWYQETNTSSPTAGVVSDTVFEHHMVSTGNYRIAIPLKDRFVRVSVKGDITDGTSSVTVTAVGGIV